MLAAMLRDDVLARGPGVLGADAPLELRPLDELDHRLAAEPSRHPGGQPPQRHRLRGHDVEARADGGRAGQCPLEGLRDVIGVHVMQHAQPQVGQRQRLTGGQPPPDVEIEVARRRDRRPRAGDVPGMQHHARDAAGDRLAVQQRLDRRLAGAVLAVRGARLVLGDRHAVGRAVDPDRAAVHEQRPGRAQRLHELRADSGVKQSMSTTASAPARPPARRTPRRRPRRRGRRRPAATLRHSAAGT